MIAKINNRKSSVDPLKQFSKIWIYRRLESHRLASDLEILNYNLG